MARLCNEGRGMERAWRVASHSAHAEVLLREGGGVGWDQTRLLTAIAIFTRGVKPVQQQTGFLGDFCRGTATPAAPLAGGVVVRLLLRRALSVAATLSVGTGKRSFRAGLDLTLAVCALRVEVPNVAAARGSAGKSSHAGVMSKGTRLAPVTLNGIQSTGRPPATDHSQADQLTPLLHNTLPLQAAVAARAH